MTTYYVDDDRFYTLHREKSNCVLVGYCTLVCAFLTLWDKPLLSVAFCVWAMVCWALALHFERKQMQLIFVFEVPSRPDLSPVKSKT